MLVNLVGDEYQQGVQRRLQVAPLDLVGRLRDHWIAVLVLVAHVGVATWYSVTIPIWEAYDETGHYNYARYVATKRTVPHAGDPDALMLWMTFQPPAYYLLAGATMSWIDVSDNLVPTRNPYFAWGTSGVNYVIHTESEQFPYSGTVLAVHVLRLLSIGIGTVGVVFTYLTGLVIAPQRRWIAVGAMAVHAFWPQFLFTGSMVTNDVLAATMGSVVTFLLVWIVLRGTSGPKLMALGVSLGLSLLSKVNTLAFFPIAGSVLFAQMVQRLRDVRGRKDWSWWAWFTLSLVPIGLSFLVLWSITFIGIPGVLRRRTAFGTGDLTRRSLAHAGVGTWTSIADALSRLAKSFYALFGWGNLEVAPPLYTAYFLVAALALIGLVTLLVRSQRLVSRSALWVCIAVILILPALVLATAARSNNIYYANGRYLLPGLSAFSILLFGGLAGPWPIRAQKTLALTAAIVMFTVGIALPFHTIAPAYARPQLLTLDEVDALATPLEATFDDVAQLVGYRIVSRGAKPGRRIGVVLYWRALKKPSDNYTVLVEIVGPDGQGYGSDASYPANGNFATSQWEPGDIFEDDSYIIRISEEFPAPAGALITAALVEQNLWAPWALPEERPSFIGDRVTLQQIGVYGSAGAGPCEDAVETSYEFGDRIRLAGYSLDAPEQPPGDATVTLCWEALQQMDQSYVVFVHLRDATGELLSQHDSPPRQGDYPTFLWAPGQMVADVHSLDVAQHCAASACEIYVGLYDVETLERLQVLDADGARVAGDEVRLD